MSKTSPVDSQGIVMPNPSKHALKFDHLEDRSLLSGTPLHPAMLPFAPLTQTVLDTAAPLTHVTAPLLGTVDHMLEPLTPVTRAITPILDETVGYFTPLHDVVNVVDQIVSEGVSPVVETVVADITPIVNVAEPVAETIVGGVDPLLPPAAELPPVTVNLPGTPTPSVDVTPALPSTPSVQLPGVTPTRPTDNTPVTDVTLPANNNNTAPAAPATNTISAPTFPQPAATAAAQSPVITASSPTISVPADVTVQEEANAATFIVIQTNTNVSTDISAVNSSTPATADPSFATDVSAEAAAGDESALHPMGMLEQAMSDGVERLDGFVNDALGQVSTWDDSAGLLPWLSALAVAGVVYEVARRDIERKREGRVTAYPATRGLADCEIK